MRRRIAACSLVVALALAGCGNDAGPAIDRDMGWAPDRSGVIEAGAPPFALHTNPADRAKHLLGSQVTVSLVAAETAHSYRWTIIDPKDRPITVQDSREALVDLTMAGTYFITCTVTRADRKEEVLSGNISARDPSIPERAYRVRITPPPDQSLPTRELHITMAGADRLDERTTIHDEVGKSLQVTWGGVAADTQLRIYSPTDLTVPLRDELLLGGKGSVKLPTSFLAIFLPLSLPPEAAALVKKVDNVGPLSEGWPGNVSVGELVKGTILSPGGQPLAGAAVSATVSSEAMKAASSVAKTDAAGNFSIYVRRGEAELVISPPLASGLPPTVVSAVGMPPSGPLADWKFAYTAQTITTLSGTLTRSDGASQPAAGAMVVLSRTDQPVVGTLSVGSLTLQGTARLRYTLASDAGGQLRELSTGASTLSLLTGTYTAEVWPAKAESPDQGYATISSTLTAQPAAMKLSLGKRVLLSGTVTRMSTAPVLVVARAGDRSFAASTDAAGKFGLSVDANTTYQLAARAQGASGKREAMLLAAGVQMKTADKALSAMQLPYAVVYSGRLTTSGGMAIPRAVVRVWCNDPSCPGKELVDETLSDNLGSFVLRFPAGENKP